MNVELLNKISLISVVETCRCSLNLLRFCTFFDVFGKQFQIVANLCLNTVLPCYVLVLLTLSFMLSLILRILLSHFSMIFQSAQDSFCSMLCVRK